MRRATLAASAALITLGATGSLADRSLALPLSDPRVHDLAIAGSPHTKGMVSPLVAMARSSLGPKLLARW